METFEILSPDNVGNVASSSSQNEIPPPEGTPVTITLGRRHPFLACPVFGVDENHFDFKKEKTFSLLLETSTLKTVFNVHKYQDFEFKKVPAKQPSRDEGKLITSLERLKENKPLVNWKDIYDKVGSMIAKTFATKSTLCTYLGTDVTLHRFLQWLLFKFNDEIVNELYTLFQRVAVTQRQDIQFFQSWAMDSGIDLNKCRISQSSGRSQSKEDFLQSCHGKWILPYNAKIKDVGHWVNVVVDWTERKIVIQDSLPNSEYDLQNFITKLNKMALGLSDKRLFQEDDISYSRELQQQDELSCGIYMCTSALASSLGISPSTLFEETKECDWRMYFCYLLFGYF